jgi:hypothetical protein
MSASQLTYTSCRMGESGSAGFQFRSASPGVTQEERREVESFTGYTPPVRPADAGEPTIEEIQGSYPRMQRFHRLKSNRWALSLSCYVGKDYTGRGGNFFAHTLIGEGALPGWPVDYYDWEGWQSVLLPEADTNDRPAPLPLVDIASILPSASFTLPVLRDFIMEQDDRAALLESMLRVVVGGLEQRKLVIKADFLDGLYWIACLQKLLPAAFMEKVTFSTYQYEERRCADVNLTVDGCRFTFDEVNRERRFYMFDMLGGLHSTVSPSRDDYAAKAIGWLLRDPERLLGGFHTFAQDFTLTTSPDALFWAARLFEASEGVPPVPARAELSAILEMVSRSTTPAGYDRVLEVVAGLAGHARDSVNVEDHERLVGFFADAASATRRPEHRAHAWRAWVDMLVALADARSDVFARVVAARQRLEALLGAWAPELAEALLGEGHHDLTDRVGPKGNPAWERVLGEVIHQLRVLRRAPLTAQPQAAFWIAKIFRAEPAVTAARSVLKALGPDPQVAVEAALHLAAELPKYRDDQAEWTQFHQECGRHLGAMFNGLPPQEAAAARRALDHPAGHPILLGEWAARIERSPRPLEVYREYQRSVLSQVPAFARAMQATIIEELDRSLDPAQRSRLAWEAIQYDELRGMSPELQRRLLASANDTLIFERDARPAMDVIERVYAMTRQLRVVLRPDRPALWLALDRLREPNAARPAAAVEAGLGVAQLADLPPEEQRALLGSLLSFALLRLRSPEDHRALVRSLSGDAVVRSFLLAYLDVLPNAPLGAVHLYAVAEFWLDAPAVERLRPPPSMASEVRDVLIARLAKLEPRELDHVTSSLRNEFRRFQRDDLPVEMLLGGVEKKRKSSGILGSVGSFFKGSSKGRP